DTLGGVYQGVDVPCTDSLCATAPFGACCLGFTSCVEVNSTETCDMLGGFYQGVDVPCTESLCATAPFGACCIGFISCVEVDSADSCDTLGGLYQGIGVVCTGTLCLPPIGACCLMNDCFAVTSDECNLVGGTYFGDDSTCQEKDSDGDGVPDLCDLCPTDPDKTSPGNCGCGVADRVEQWITVDSFGQSPGSANNLISPVGITVG
ncbi:MAG: hypothetical protein KC983_12135, partial [Phycisphaerales bacterium]|nr:hypothetical protein [Phycisphaerales bacterium]